MWEFLGKLGSFVLVIFEEFFSARARAREEKRVFVIDQTRFNQLVGTAMERMIRGQASDSGGAGNGWDSSDGAAKLPSEDQEKK